MGNNEECLKENNTRSSHEFAGRAQWFPPETPAMIERVFQRNWTGALSTHARYRDLISPSSSTWTTQKSMSNENIRTWGKFVLD